MSKKEKTSGWTVDATKYLRDIKESLEDPLVFSSFKRLENYTKILSGGDKKVGELILSDLEHCPPELLKTFLSSFKKAKENDLIGNPVIHDFGRFGAVASDTIKYAWNSSVIKWGLLKNTEIKSVVEVGAGYGGMCKIFHDYVHFNNYTIIDLPLVLKLCEKYLKHFTNLKEKIKFIDPDETGTVASLGPFDLLIADSSIAECSVDQQKFYYESLLPRCKYGYIVYNTLHTKTGFEGWLLLRHYLEENKFKVQYRTFPHSSVAELLLEKTIDD